MTYILMILSISASAQSNGCQPESLERLASIEQKLVSYSTKVDEFKRKNPHPYQPTRQPSSDQIKFCLVGGVREAAVLARQGLAINDELELFANAQGGACRGAAQQALSNIETRVRDLIAYTKSCD